jgi:hypothetical protein
LNSDGVGQGFSGPNGTFVVNSAPPDTNGAVGPNHYVQVVNTDFAIFNKAGTPVYGPVPINTLWSGFGGVAKRTTTAIRPWCTIGSRIAGSSASFR